MFVWKFDFVYSTFARFRMKDELSIFWIEVDKEEVGLLSGWMMIEGFDCFGRGF
jgi:hypothetical protein